MRACKKMVGRAGVIGLCAGAGFAWSSAQAAQVTANWLAPVSGSWVDATKWSGGNFPNNGNPAGTTYHAVIEAVGGPYTVTLDQSVTLDQLTMNAAGATLRSTGGTLAFAADGALSSGRFVLAGEGMFTDGALDAHDRVDWESGFIAGSGSLRVSESGVLTLAGGGVRALYASLETDGATAWTGGTVQFGGFWTNRGLMTVDAAEDVFMSATGGLGVMFNEGIIEKRGEGRWEIGGGGAGTIGFSNLGVVRVLEGSLDCVGTVSGLSGLVEIAAGAEAHFRSSTLGAQTLLTGAGDVTFYDRFVNAGTISIDGTLHVMREQGSPVPGEFNGTVTAGRIELASGSNAAFHGAVSVQNGLLVAGGSATFSGSLELNGSGIELGGGSLSLQGQGESIEANSLEMNGNIFGAAEIIVADGFEWRSGTLATTTRVLQDAESVIGGGALRILNGSLTLEGNAALQGSLQVLTAGQLHLQGGLHIESPGDIELYGAGSIVNEGEVRVSGGVTRFRNGLTLNGSGGFFVDSGIAEVQSVNFNLPSFTIADGATVRFVGSQIRDEDFRGDGTAEFVSGQSSILSGSAVETRLRLQGGTLTVRDGAALSGPLSVAGGVMILEGHHELNGVELTAGDLSLQQGLSVTTDGSMFWTGGRLLGVGGVEIDGGLTLHGSAEKTLGVATTTRGATEWTGGSLRLDAGVVNEGDWLIAMGSGVTASILGSGGFTNDGLLRVDGGKGSTVSRASGSELLNRGEMRVESGRVSLASGVRNEGEIRVDAGGRLDVFGGATLGVIYGAGTLGLRSGSFTLAPGGVTLSGTLLVDGASAVLQHLPTNALDLRSGSVSTGLDLTLQDALRWAGGTISGSGEWTTAVGAVVEWSGEQKTLGSGAGLRLLDGATWTGGGLSLHGLVENFGSIEATGVTRAVTGVGSFVQHGSLATTAHLRFDLAGGGSFDNYGSVVVDEAELHLRGVATNHGTIELQNGAWLRLDGTFEQVGFGMVFGDGSLHFAGGQHTMDERFVVTGPVSVSGGELTVVNGAGATQWTFSGGTTMFSEDVAPELTSMSGGSVVGDGVRFDTEALTWTRGTIGSGIELFAGSVSMTSSTGPRVLSSILVSEGAAALTSGALTLDGGLLRAIGEFDASAGVQVTTAGAGGLFENLGGFAASGVGQVTLSGTGLSLKNDGGMTIGDGTTLAIGASFATLGDVSGPGTLRLTGGGGAIGGGVNVGRIELALGDFVFDAPVQTGSWQFLGGSALFLGAFDAGASLQVQGSSLVFAGELFIDPSAVVTLAGGVLDAAQQDWSVSTLLHFGGSLRGSGDLLINDLLSFTAGSMDGEGRTIVGQDATATIGVASPLFLRRQLVVQGDTTLGLVLLRMPGGTLRNEGTLTTTSYPGAPSSLLGEGAGGLLVNEGTIVKQGSGELRLLNNGGAMSFQNTGLLDVREGKVRLEGEAVTTNEGTYAMAHAGSVAVTGEFVNAIGATLSFEVGGMKDRGLSGLMTITGEASLAGTLTVNTPEAFNATWGDRWVVMSYGSVEGDFDVFDLPTEGFASRSDDFGASDLRWYAERGETEYAVGVSHIADIDHDGLIGFGDLNIIASNFNAFGSWAQGDVDGDGFVGFTDLNAVLSLFNLAAPRSVPGPGAVFLAAVVGMCGVRRNRGSGAPVSA